MPKLSRGRSRPTPTERLVERLCEAGFTGVVIEPVKGYWKSQDCYRWEGTARRDGREVSLGSYDTVSDCASRGFSFRAESLTSYEFFAQERTNPHA